MASVFTIIQEGKTDTYEFEFYSPSGETDVSINAKYTEGLDSTISAIKSLKNGEVIGFTREIGCSWITFDTGSLVWTENTGYERDCVVTLTQNESNKKCYIRIHQEANYTFKWTTTDATDINDTISWNNFTTAWKETTNLISTRGTEHVSWTATTDASWITPTWSNSTTGINYITLTVDSDNTSEEPRVGVVTLLQDDSGKKLTWTVTQNGKPKEKPIITFNKVIVSEVNYVYSIQRDTTFPVPTSTVTVALAWGTASGNYQHAFVLEPDMIESEIYAIPADIRPFHPTMVSVHYIQPTEDENYRYVAKG